MKLKERFGLARSALVVMIMDIVLVNLSAVFSILVTQNFVLQQETKALIMQWFRIAPVFCLITLIVFYIFHMYHMIWTLVSLRELLRGFPAVVISFFFGILAGLAMGISFSLSVCFLMVVFMMLSVLAMRLSYRVFHIFLAPHPLQHDKKITRVMIIGAGKAGQTIVRELLTMDTLSRKPCCIIDDNETKLGKFLEGVPIVGGCSTIPRMVKEYKIKEIIFAIPSATAKQRQSILEICNKTGCAMKILPGIYQMIDGEVSIKNLRDVRVEDLLAREPVRVNNECVLEELRGKTVLVTGGGGSIGSELCRQIAAHQPGLLIIFDIYENCAYDVQQELKKRYPSLNLKVLIGSVRDTARMEQLFSRERPEVVFHAAAHKHVPLMEDSPCEAVKNNVFGTYNTAYFAKKYGAKKFLLISTDKAVNPTNVMGATKRLCEMVVQYFSQDSSTKFSAVRFGNVLGSNGSVVPLFRKQIEQGGPVTVTDKNIIRFFMTIPEAVSLILQASAFAENGETFVLDMGEPVRIDDMARNMIRLCGFEPDVDIKIVYTGLRPGEKLYEELLMDEEGLSKTENDLIYIGKPIELDYDEFARDLEQLREAGANNRDEIRELIMKMVPTYHPKSAVTV